MREKTQNNYTTCLEELSGGATNILGELALLYISKSQGGVRVEIWKLYRQMDLGLWF